MEIQIESVVTYVATGETSESSQTDQKPEGWAKKDIEALKITTSLPKWLKDLKHSNFLLINNMSWNQLYKIVSQMMDWRSNWEQAVEMKKWKRAGSCQELRTVYQFLIIFTKLLQIYGIIFIKKRLGYKVSRRLSAMHSSRNSIKVVRRKITKRQERSQFRRNLISAVSRADQK